LALSSWPKIPYLGRQYLLDVLDFSLGHPVLKHEEHGADHNLRIDTVIILDLLFDSGQKLLLVALFQRLVSRIPAFVVEPTD
jgi:hypothetical protein